MGSQIKPRARRTLVSAALLAGLFYVIGSLVTDGDRGKRPSAGADRPAGMEALPGRSCPLTTSSSAPSEIRNISVLGERHTGTNSMEQLLSANVDTGLVGVRSGVTAHKHWMQPAPAAPLAGTLVVVMTSNAYDWLNAMHKKCYHCEAFENLTFEAFASARWVTPMSADLDRDIEAEAEFTDALAMRQAKVCHWLSFARRHGAAVELVRWEDQLFPHQQLELVRRLSQKYGLPKPGGAAGGATFVRADTKRSIRKPTFNSSRVVEESPYFRPDLASEELLARAAALSAQLDAAFEAALGYSRVPP